MDIQNSYDKIAKYFCNTRVYTWLWITDFLETLKNNKYNNKYPNESNAPLIILDIGSGNGRIRNSLKTLFNDSEFLIFGMDLSFEQLRMNNNNKNGNFDCQANMTLLPYKDKSFDAILSIASFHHLSTIQEREMCLQEMKRVIKPRGKILLSVWSINQPTKTKRKFHKYGHTNVPWNTNIKDANGEFIIIPRYYYIFELSEIINLLSKYFKIIKHKWDCGNEIFELI